MSDPTTAVPVPTTPVAPPTTQPLSVGDTLNTVLNNAPELKASPGLAVTAATAGGDTALVSQNIARASTASSDISAAKTVDRSSGGILGSALNWFGNTVSHAVGDVADAAKTGFEDVAKPALGLLNKPMQLVQHEYRYLHDVEATHGMGVAIAEGLGIAAAAVGVGVATGGTGLAALSLAGGAGLGAMAAGSLEGQAFYRDSWERTGSASYEDPHTHQPVSLGRDIASVLGLSRTSEPFKVVSGAIDGTFDMAINIPGIGLLKAIHSVEGAGGALGSIFQGYGVMDGEKVQHAFDEGASVGMTSPFKRAMQYAAGKSVGELVATPGFDRLPETVLTRLSQAHDAEEAKDVFKGVAATQELAFVDRLPTLSRTRAYVSLPIRAAAGDVSMTSRLGQNVIAGPGRWFHRLSPIATSINDKGLTSMKELDPMSPDFVRTMYQTALYTENRRTAIDIASAVNDMPHIEQRIIAFRNLQMRTLMNLGDMRLSGTVGNEAEETHLMLKAAFTDPAQAERAMGQLNKVLDQGMFGKEAIYGYDKDGNNVSLIRDKKSGMWNYSAAVTDSQVGNLTMMDFGLARRLAKSLKNADSIFSAEDMANADTALGKLRIQIARGDYLGRIDEQGYRAITAGIFKPLVLLTPSYAMHISLAEMIPNALRLGVLNLVKKTLLINMAKLGIREGDLHLSEESAEHFMAHLNDVGLNTKNASLIKTPEALAGLAWHLIGMGRKALPSRIDASLEKQLQRAVTYIDGQGGELIDPALQSNHSLSDMTTNREETATRVLRQAVEQSALRSSGKFTEFGNADENFTNKWATSLNRYTRGDPGSQFAAKIVLEELRNGESTTDAINTAKRLTAGWIRDKKDSDPVWAEKMLRNNPDMTAMPPGVDPPVEWDSADEFAHVKVAALEGITTGADGTLHRGLLQHVADGSHTTVKELDIIKKEARPTHVHGAEVIPSGDSPIQRIANVGFEKVLNPMVNFLSRQPLALAEYSRQMDQLEPLVDKGIMTADQVDVLARTRAAVHGVRFIHNLNDRTQWTVTMRNWAPFWFAQEQAYRRMGRLLSEDPVAFRKYQLMISNIGNVGQVFTSPGGTPYFVMPHTGFFNTGARVLGALSIFGNPLVGSSPVGLGWNLNASSVIFPLSAGARPDLGPLLGIPTQVIANFFAEHAGATLSSQIVGAENAVLGATASGSVWSQFVPNTVLDRLLTAWMPSFDERAFDSTFMSTLQTLDYEHQIPPPNASPAVLQAFLDKWRNQTRIMYAAKALVGAITPVSPEIVVNDFGLPAELTADITKAGSVTAGITEFLSKHPDAVPYTVFQSQSQYGVSVPSSVPGEDWINANMGLIDKYGAAALALMPSVPTTYNATVYNEQLAQGLRTKLQPETAGGPLGSIPSYIQQLYIAAGNATVLDKWYPAYKASLAGLAGQEKYQAELNWQTATANYALQNPVWGAWWNSDQKATERAQAVVQMKAMFAAGDEPQGPLSTKVAGLLNDYQAYEDQIIVGQQNSFAGETQSQINADWQDYLEQRATADPTLRPVIDTLFLTLPTAPTGT